jgi:hypothetical protein
MLQLLHSCGLKPRGSGSGFADCAKTSASALVVCVQNQLFLRYRRHRCCPTLMQGDEPVRAKFRYWAAMSHLTRKGPKSLVIRRAWACVIPCFLAK